MSREDIQLAVMAAVTAAAVAVNVATAVRRQREVARLRSRLDSEVSLAREKLAAL